MRCQQGIRQAAQRACLRQRFSAKGIGTVKAKLPVFQRIGHGLLVHQCTARSIQQDHAGLCLGKGGRVDQPPCCRCCRAVQAEHIAAGKQGVKIHEFHTVGFVLRPNGAGAHQHLHAKGLGNAGGLPANAAVAIDAKGLAQQFHLRQQTVGRRLLGAPLAVLHKAMVTVGALADGQQQAEGHLCHTVSRIARHVGYRHAMSAAGLQIKVIRAGGNDAHDKAVELQEETGMTFIHPYDDEQVIAGQGTIGLEILDQLPDVDAVVVPVGGGGLISGVAFAIKSLRPEVKVYGVQAEGAPSMYRSLHEHKYQTLKAVSTFADGIQVKTPGELTYQICEQYVDDIVTVSEDETAAAILSLMENQKLVAEGAGAVPVAAVLFHKLPVEGKKVACVVSGGNIDVNILNRVITRGLVMSGRKANMTIALEDKPGQLKKVAEIVSRCGSNVVSVQHDGSDPNMPISSCFLKLTLETRDAEQIEQIRAELAKEGFQLVSERV